MEGRIAELEDELQVEKMAIAEERRVTAEALQRAILEAAKREAVLQKEVARLTKLVGELNRLTSTAEPEQKASLLQLCNK